MKAQENEKDKEMEKGSKVIDTQTFEDAVKKNPATGAHEGRNLKF